MSSEFLWKKKRNWMKWLGIPRFGKRHKLTNLNLTKKLIETQPEYIQRNPHHSTSSLISWKLKTKKKILKAETEKWCLFIRGKNSFNDSRVSLETMKPRNTFRYRKKRTLNPESYIRWNHAAIFRWHVCLYRKFQEYTRTPRINNISSEEL